MLVCNRAGEPAATPVFTGYYCQSCGHAVQVSAEAVRQIRQGAEPWCGPCGMTVAVFRPASPLSFNPSAEPYRERILAELQALRLVAAFGHARKAEVH
jgi:hypothetical protein